MAEVTFKELLDHINSGAEKNKSNCSIGLFLSDYYEDSIKENKNLILKKPVVAISSFTEDNELYYSVSFYFKSFNDVDYKQFWRFICNFTEKAKAEERLQVSGETLEKMSVFSVSIVPDK